MLEWDKLLSEVKRKDLSKKNESFGSAVGRLAAERDFDRILFATPTRRLADKTQVFPMEVNDSVRNRLTHSHEVSNLARSIGVQIAFGENAEKIFGEDHLKLEVNRKIPAMLAAVGLAHDMGNPPFGHQGENSMQQWFNDPLAKDGNNIEDDFLLFDGNAQTFRLVTKLQVLNDSFGLNLSCGTLAALLKYPSVYGSKNKGGFKKHGVFKSEEDALQDVWSVTGLSEGVRHPLAYIMEACDDIAYSIIDAEDTVKKGYASFYDLMDFLTTNAGHDPVVEKVVKKCTEENKNFKNKSLSSRELNDVSMQMFRVIAMSEMVPATVDTFIENINSMMTCTISDGFELLDNSSCAVFCKTTKDFDYKHGFTHKDVLKIELEGNNYIKNMMTMLWRGIKLVNGVDGELNNAPFERYAYGSISENYRRIYEDSDMSMYHKYQLLCDSVSGMTEKYLISKHDELKKLML